MSYELKREDIDGLVSFIGIPTRLKKNGREIEFRECPMCHGGGHHDEWTFSINTETGKFCCLRSSCDYKGHFVELCRDQHYKLELETEQEYKALPQPKGKIIPRESAYAYLESRGISRATAERYEVTSFEDKPNILWFPFRNEYGKIVFAKFRNMLHRAGMKGSKEWCESGCQPILFGMYQCTDFERLIITEGQIDSLTVAECGYPNAVSVPTGKNGFTWLPNCYDWIRRFKEIVVFGDMEHGHMTLLDTLRSRLPDMNIKAVQNADYLGEKDANDIYRAFGREAIQRAVEGAKESQLGYVKELADVEDVDLNTLPKVRTGIYELDAVLGGGICYGQVVLLTGKRGGGKSTFMSNIVADALDQGDGVFAYSGELAGYHFKRWLNYQLCGNDYLTERRNEFDQTVYSIPEDISKRISEWYRGRAYIYDNEYIDPASGTDEMESLTDVVRKVVSRKNIKLVCIDNLMTAMDSVRSQNDLYLAQSNFVGDLKKIAVQYNVAIILVAHPRKSQQGKEDFDNDDVSGASDITNKVDIVLNYHRAKEGSDHESELDVSKNRLAGNLAMGKNCINLRYSPKTKRVFGFRTLSKHYGWERGTDEEPEIDVPF